MHFVLWNVYSEINISYLYHHLPHHCHHHYTRLTVALVKSDCKSLTALDTGSKSLLHFSLRPSRSQEKCRPTCRWWTVILWWTQVHSCIWNFVKRFTFCSFSAPSVEALYRPDPKKSVEDELYDSLENPSPVPEIAFEIYGMHANGTVNVWIEDPAEMEYLRTSLKVKNCDLVLILIWLNLFHLSFKAYMYITVFHSK